MVNKTKILIYYFIKKIYNHYIKRKRENYIKGLVNKGLKLGENVDIIDTFFFDPSHCFLISIGNNTTICPNVRVIAHDASTKKLIGYTKIGRIDIGQKCFIGDSAIILPNVRIGDNSIIGAGSVVTRNIPANSVAVGNPAKIICSTEEYKIKNETIIKTSRLFDETYLIHSLDNKKREEIKENTKDKIGFIV